MEFCTADRFGLLAIFGFESTSELTGNSGLLDATNGLFEFISNELLKFKEETGVVDSSSENGIAEDFEFFFAVKGAFINGFWFDEFFELDGVL